jgi:protein-S-isoprenylcysteine O-methyltransferase Ste14
MDNSSSAGPSSANARSTGELKIPTGPLKQPSAAAVEPAALPVPRGFIVRLAELIILMSAIVGAVAIGLGIGDYMASHRYVLAYLVAYGVFRFADLLVRDSATLGLDPACFMRRVVSELPLLLLFFAAPFERTYIYGGDAPRWIGGLGLLIELAGLWLVLGARIQLGFFSPERSSDNRSTLVRNGIYRFIRHPIYGGEFIVLFAWPFEYAAPISLLLVSVVGIAVMVRRIKLEEAAMLAKYGDEYASYMQVTDHLIPNVW